MRRILAVSLALSLTGCATIVGGGSRQNIGFTSTPSGARVIVDGVDRGVTPAMVRLKRRDEHLVRLELAGYEPYAVTLKRGVNGWVWGNIIFGGLPGLAVDAITGALYKLKPGDVNATFTTKTGSRGGEGVYVAVVMQPDPSWEKIGQLKAVNGR